MAGNKTGRQYAGKEDAAHVSGDEGVQILVVRKDSAASLCGTDGDYTPLQVDANGSLRITGSVSAATEFAEDEQHTTADKGIMSLAVRKDTATQLAGTDGDYSPLITDANGRLHVLDQNSAAILSDTSDIKTAVEKIDDWDESDRCKVNLIAGQVGIAANAGAVGATVPRVTLCSDDPAVADLAELEKIFDGIPTSGASVGDIDGNIRDQLHYIATQTAAAAGDLEIMDDWDDANKCRMTPVATDVVTYGSDTILDADADNSAQVLKAGSGNLYKIDVYNSNAAIAFIQLFDVAAGSVTVGTTTPKYFITVPPQGAASIDFAVPMSFDTAITYAATTTPTGSGDPVAGLQFCALYK